MATAMHGNGESLWRMLAGVVILLREVSDFLETVGKFSVFLARPSPRCPAFVLMVAFLVPLVYIPGGRRE